jgi:hypothetical protein
MVSEPHARERPTHGRYYVEYVRTTSDAPQDQLQSLLDEKDAREWHLIGVAGGLPQGGMMFFWDTQRPSFGRSSR